MEKNYLKNISSRTILLIAFSLFSFIGFSQQWRSSLYPANWTPPIEADNFYTNAFIQDFSYAGYHSGEKNIPTIINNIIDVTKAPYSADNTGVTDVTAKIQSAINKAQNDGGGVVYLPAGTYKLSAGTNNYCLLINKSNVVLRGAGVGNTFLFNNDNNMRSKDIITIEGSGGNWKAQPSTVAKITRDLNGPTTIIPVDNTNLFQVGDKVVLRQTLTAAWANEHNEPEWGTSANAASLGGVINFRTIKSINTTAKTITIDAPIRYAFKTRDGACVYKSPATMIEEVGLEDFSIGNREVVTNFNDWVETGSTTDLLNDAEKTATKGAYKCHASYLVGFNKVINSWMRNVSTYTPSVNQFKTQMLSNGVKLELSRGITIDNVDVGYSQYGGGGGNAYGFRIESNDCLIKNSKAEFTRHGFVFSFMHSSGNVLYNNICKKSGKCTGNAPNGLNTGSSGSDFHMWFSPSNLIDNMTFDESYFSAVHRKAVASDHNSVSAHSVFWNTTGTNARASVVIRTSQTRYGYVMGTKGNTPTVDYRDSDNMNLAFRYDTDGSRTSPEDKVEGIGKGADLMPQSLYIDQLNKRLNTTCTATITSPSISFCTGGSVVLTANTGSSYKWFNGTTQVGTAATYTATTASSYTVEVTNAAGCKATSAAKVITVNALPTATITSPANSFCTGGNVVLTASAGTSYKWFNGTTQVGTAATYTATAAGSYTVEVTNAAGCKATSAAKVITVNALPTATITSPANAFCTGENVVLTASTGASYKWFNGTTQVGTAATYTATAAGSYTVEVTNAAGCKATSAAKVITVNALPTATITSPANSFCTGGSVVLTASAGASYKWFNGTTQVGTAASYTATTAGSYTVEVTNANSCKTTSATKVITVNALPTATITSPVNSFCAGGSVVLTASAGTSYKWFNGTTQVGTAATYTATTAGSYTVEVTNAAGCKTTSAAKIITVTASVTWYSDADNDGKGDPSSTISACTQPVGYVSITGDNCPTDANKIEPGLCGCSVTENSCTNQSQTISFTTFDGNKITGDPDFNLTASSTTGLTITYTSSNPNVAIIVGNTVKIIGPGTTTITAVQSGNAFFAPASAAQTLVVSNPIQQGILQVYDGNVLLTDNSTAIRIGSAPLNTPSASKTITLKNTGTGSITITSIVGSTGFNATQIFPAGPIAPNQTATITISGTPADATAPTTGAITILNNGTPQLFTLNVFVEMSTTTASAGNLSSSQIDVFPNPATDNLSLDFHGSFDDIQIKVYSIEGKFVLQEEMGTVTNAEKYISINELPAGIYFMEIKTKQGKIIKRIIKQ